MQLIEIETRIAEIDQMFKNATFWGSWMSEASSERRSLVDKAARLRKIIPHNHVLRTTDGHISD